MSTYILLFHALITSRFDFKLSQTARLSHTPFSFSVERAFPPHLIIDLDARSFLKLNILKRFIAFNRYLLLLLSSCIDRKKTCTDIVPDINPI